MFGLVIWLCFAPPNHGLLKHLFTNRGNLCPDFRESGERERERKKIKKRKHCGGG